MKKGFTLLEILVVVGIVVVLCLLIFPIFANARLAAKRTQCMNNLHQLDLALVMYSTDSISSSGGLEVYPGFLTNLYPNYVADQRLFVCPMDTTNATVNSAGITTLKPGNPVDNKASWAERLSLGNKANCSYLYEFSGRECEEYTLPGDKWTYWTGLPNDFADNYLCEWFVNPNTNLGSYYTPTPADMNRSGSINGAGVPYVSWQDAKFWQLNNGDEFVTGDGWPGVNDIPTNWTSAPFDSVSNGNTPQRSYPRTWMPIIRCFWHCTSALVDFADNNDEGPEEVLNISLDNTIFMSVPGWEQTSWKYGRSLSEN